MSKYYNEEKSNIKLSYQDTAPIKNKKNLFIYGAGYFDIVKLVEAINRVQPTWNIVGFIDDIKNKYHGNVGHSYPLLGGRDKLYELAKLKDNYFISNLGGNCINCKSNYELLISQDCKIATLIHPSIDMNMVEVGQGCILPEGCVIGSNTKLGNFITVRLKGLISHDVLIEDYVFIGPGATIGGKSILKERCFIGTGAVVMSGITIGEGSIVGAGAVVTKDVPPNTVVIGIPAKPMCK